MILCAKAVGRSIETCTRGAACCCAKRSYDERCEDLARYFYPNGAEHFIAETAQALQSIIESDCEHPSLSEQGRCMQCGEVPSAA